MADLYIPKNPAALHSPGPQQAPAAAAKSAVETATFASDMEAATAFQKHLDKGYQGMLEVWQTLPPEVQAVAGDPSAQSDSQEAQLDWYFKVNEAVTKQQAMSQAQAGDYAAADATAMTGPASKETRTALGGFTADRKAEGLAKQVGDFAQSLGTGGSQAYGAADLSPKSKFGRSMKITQARLEPYAADLTATASQYGVPESLIKAVITRESTGNAKAQPKDAAGNLRSSAKGLMQLIDATAGRFGVTDAFDPKQNISGGTQYLKFLIDRYGDVEKAVAAYHEGETKLDRIIQEKGEAWREGLSDDAKAYVPDVMKMFQAYGGGEIKTAPQGVGSMEKLVADMLKQNPQMVNTPEGKALADAVKFDISMGARAAGQGGVQERFDANQQRLMDAAAQKAYQAYSKQIERESPVANSILEIDRFVGGLDSGKPLPGLGAGMKGLRKLLMTDATPEADAMRIMFSNLFGDIGLATGGQNFTKAEMDRLEERLRQSNLATEASVRRALRSQRDKIYQQIANKFSAMPESAQQAAIEDEVINPTMFGEFTTLAGQKRKYGQKSEEPEAPPAEAGAGAPVSGMAADRKARLEELRKKKAAGTLGKN
jgi:soluble lytic murein transglycosylase-like protein